MPVSDDHLAADQRVAAEPARQRGHAHSVIDAELKGLHPWRCDLPSGVAFQRRRRLGGEPAHHRERVIDIARAIVLGQLRVAAARRGNADLLRPPVEIEPDLVGRELHEGPHARMGIEQALGLRVAPGRGAEWKQARPVAAIGADRDAGADDDPEAVAQRVDALDRRVAAGHHAECVAVEL